MRQLLEILLCMAAAVAFLWLFLKGGLLMEDLGQRVFGPNFHWGRQRAPKVEIQTLFHGNTKDQDQI